MHFIDLFRSPLQQCYETNIWIESFALLLFEFIGFEAYALVERDHMRFVT